jgi:hypothetical protein
VVHGNNNLNQLGEETCSVRKHENVISENMYNVHVGILMSSI